MVPGGLSVSLGFGGRGSTGSGEALAPPCVLSDLKSERAVLVHYNRVPPGPRIRHTYGAGQQWSIDTNFGHARLEPMISASRYTLAKGPRGHFHDCCCPVPLDIGCNYLSSSPAIDLPSTTPVLFPSVCSCRFQSCCLASEPYFGSTYIACCCALLSSHAALRRLASVCCLAFLPRPCFVSCSALFRLIAYTTTPAPAGGPAGCTGFFLDTQQRDHTDNAQMTAGNSSGAECDREENSEEELEGEEAAHNSLEEVVNDVHLEVNTVASGRCALHTLQLCVHDVLKTDKNIKSLLNKVRKIVNKTHTQNMRLIFKNSSVTPKT
ncbi:hypothetical protein GWK47_030787 [Chionoecetes opilio]|uniref:Uncharacterized protein n=1 Tax=Chionoecetes opilio TaxID=41210 RepID=A0A8J4YRH7_CHIOP|nr:hypothetical protein GWK47_030787 [Chionoecetes opilio]